MNIFKTFEIFLREPLSVLRERFIQIVSINSSYVSSPCINADLINSKTQITIVNNDKMYNLLKTVMYKKELQEKNQQKSYPKGQVVLGQLLKRS